MSKRRIETNDSPQQNLPLADEADSSPSDLISRPYCELSSNTTRRHASEPAPREIKISANLTLQVTPVFDTYWTFAARRQALFMRRAMGEPPPWTDDPILEAYRFTNVYRAADRVTQYLIRNVLYEGEQSGEEIFFRCLLFKLFNRIETWTKLISKLGFPTWKHFDVERYSRVLAEIMARKESVYSAAYIMPSPHFGESSKHGNHLRLLERMMRDGVPNQIEKASSLEQVFATLRSYPSFGDFLAFQYAIDLNYSAIIDFSEMDFVVAGPGAREGIQKCFVQPGISDFPEIIRAMGDIAQREFDRLGLRFDDLWGRPLQLIDCQNLFCEVGKYSRVAHPECKGSSGRMRIKQRFIALPTPIRQWYPPKWRLRLPAALS